MKGKQDEYQRISFELTPNRTDEQGRFAVTLKEPGTIILGYAFLQAGEWGRYKGLPLRKDLASVQTSLTIAGFESAKLAQVIELQAPLEAGNTAQNQTQVIPEQRKWQHGLQKGADTYTFPPYSFTITIFERKMV